MWGLESTIGQFISGTLDAPLQTFAKMSKRQQSGFGMAFLGGMDLGTTMATRNITGQIGDHQVATLLSNMGIAQFNEEQQYIDLARTASVYRGDIYQSYAANNVDSSTGSALNFGVGVARNAARLKEGIRFRAHVEQQIIQYKASMAKYQTELTQWSQTQKMLGSLIQIGVGAFAMSGGKAYTNPTW